MSVWQLPCHGNLPSKSGIKTSTNMNDPTKNDEREEAADSVPAPPPPPRVSPRSPEISKRAQRNGDGSINPVEVGHIDAIRRVSEIRVQKHTTNEENVYIDTIRRVSGANLTGIGIGTSGHGHGPQGPGAVIGAQRGLSENIIIRNKGAASSARISADHKLSSSEIGVIEAVRRLSGVNAALHELGSSANLKKDIMSSLQVQASADGPLGSKDKAAASKGKAQGKGDNFGLGDKDWHLLTELEMFAELNSSLAGLGSAEHARRLEQYGPNLITPPKQTHWLIKFLLLLVGGFQMMMWFGAILCFIVYGLSGEKAAAALGALCIGRWGWDEVHSAGRCKLTGWRAPVFPACPFSLFAAPSQPFCLSL